MKTKLIFIAFLFLSISMSAQWKPAGDKIKTAWAETLNLDNILSEYRVLLWNGTAG